MYLLRISLRNLFRRRKRTLLISGILMVAVLAFLFLESFMLGMFDVSFENIIDFETPHITVGHPEFISEADEGERLPIEETFAPDDELLAEVRDLEGFSDFTPVLDFDADFIAGRYDYPVLVRSIDPESFDEVFKHSEYIVDGDFLQPGEPGVAIGDQLADFFGLEVGDFYTLRFQDKQGSFNTLQGEVKGIFSVPHPEMNINTVLVDREEATAALALEEDMISQLMVRMEDRELAEAQAEILDNKLSGTAFEVMSYRDASELLTAIEAFGYIEIYFILALFLIVGAVGIISALVLAALERIKEIGMMKAMGLKRSQIVRVFMLEAAGIGVIGGVAGMILGGISIALLRNFGIDVAAFLDMEGLGLPFTGRLYGGLNISSFPLIFIFVVVIAILASIIPAYWAAGKDPSDAIHHK